MIRNTINSFIEWKNKPSRKPLILKGARQTGKTWLMKEFGSLYYDDFFYFDFSENEELLPIFEKSINPSRIIERLGTMKGKAILPEKHLIIFDEVQECPRALGSLKYFCEDANEYHIISAGSLLGTFLAKPMSYPVGKVDIIHIYPLSFDEFLAATDEAMYKYYLKIDRNEEIDKIFHTRLTEAYENYLIIGGMPECVLTWVNTKDPAEVKRVQSNLIQIYENDITKHHGMVNAGRILMVFRNIVSQLAKENEKFIYGCVKEGARARDFEEAIEWLVSAGLLIRVYCVSKPEHPLNAFAKLNHFKLFMLDVGLLKHMAGVSNESIILKSNYQFKGPMAENYILQQIRGLFDVDPKFFTITDSGDIDFLLQNGMEIIPVEVKSGENIRASTFNSYLKKYKPKRAIKYSKLEYHKSRASGGSSGVVYIPLYLAGKTKEML